MYFAHLKLLLPLRPVMHLSVNQRLSFFSPNMGHRAGQLSVFTVDTRKRSAGSTDILGLLGPGSSLATATVEPRWATAAWGVCVWGKLSWWICVLIQLDYFPYPNHVLENYHFIVLLLWLFRFLCRHSPWTDPFLIFSPVNRLSSSRVWLKGGFSRAQIIFLVFFRTLSNPFEAWV